MTQQFVHNVTPGPRQFVTQAGSGAAHVVNGGRPTIDSRHLAAPGVPAFNENSADGLRLREMYTEGIRAAFPLAFAPNTLAAIPLKALGEMYFANCGATWKRADTTALPKPPTANAGTKPGGSYVTELARYSLNSPNGDADPYASYPDNPGADGRGRYDLNNPMGSAKPYDTLPE